MKNTQPIRLPSPHATMVVASSARNTAIENWLNDEVAKSHDEFMADPSIGIPADAIMARLRASYLKSKAKSAS